MHRLSVFCLLFILGLLQFSKLDAQKLTDEWRVIKKIQIDPNGKKYPVEYSYTNDGRIESIKYFLVSGPLNITISDFTFDRQGKPSTYIVTWNRAGSANISLKYDNRGRISEVEKVFGREISLSNYRYSATSIIVTTKYSNSANPIKDNKLTYYTEQGDYNETTSDAATQTITSVITLKQNKRQIEPHPDNFIGGFEHPRFLGILTYGSEPEFNATKDENGLITGLTYIASNITRTYEYTYAKIKNSEPVTTIPVENIPVTIITTNINCAAGKEVVERILKSQDGVQSVKVDIRSGKLSLAYSSDGTPYTEIINLINEAGFDADRKKSTSPDKNPCKKPEPEEQTTTLTIQTNINCAEGKQKVESYLKEQNGVINATADIRSGKLIMEYNKADISTEVINRIINSAGFDADRKKSTSPDKNPCKKPEPEEQTTSVTIQTNINCAEGKQKVESYLKEQNGVVSATADIRSGKLVMEYNKADISTEVITRIINSAGFDADRKKSTSPDKNPCKKQPEPVEKPISNTIRTNINCEQGKEKVETRLKEQNGVLNAELDLNTTRVKVEYNKNVISLEKIIQVINQAGFDADKNKTTNAEENPCKNNEVNTNSITIQTNINCVEGKQNVESLLKEQNGVVSVKVDISTGKLVIEYNKTDISPEVIVRIINSAGFDADREKSNNPEDNICIKKNKPVYTITKLSGLNIFDARKGFAKAPIKFVPFVATPDAAKRGFKPDSVYTWVAPDGKTKQASGSEILKQVNEMEKELSLRGHTLRKRNAFSGLSATLVNPNALLRVPLPADKISVNVPISSKISKNFSAVSNVATIQNRLSGGERLIAHTLATTITGDVGIYFGSITSIGEYQGWISTSGAIDNSKCNTQCPLDLTLSLDASQIQSLNISQCVLEISANPNRKPNDEEVPLATANFNFKSPAKTKNGTLNVTVNGELPPSSHSLYYFPVKLNDLSKLGKATVKPAVYYAYVKFYNDKGQLIYYSSYNTAILENKIESPFFMGADKTVSAGLGDVFTDPTGLFGMYYKSNKLSAAYTSTRDEATLIVTENAKLSGDIEIGAQYYNFWHLLDDDLPKFERKSLIAANFSSEFTNQYMQGQGGIRIPGSKSNDMNGYAGYRVNYTLNDFNKDWNFNKTSKYSETKNILTYNIFNKRFFIGPVPCSISVDISGNATLTRNATMDTLKNGNVSITASVTPHLDLTLTGKGGVDAGVTYAKVICDVKVIEVDLPISVKANANADIDAALVITALSGKVYFEAGLCIPIPFFDDMCTSFRIDIFNWEGPSKTNPVQVKLIH